MLIERTNAKYYSIMVHAAPDSSHTEQNKFILRYLVRKQDQYIIQERFLTFIDEFGKTGSEIAAMILKFLKNNDIPFREMQRSGI